MGVNQSIPKITAQDRAILEFVIAFKHTGAPNPDNGIFSLKLQRDKLKQYQKKV
jgi:hypothetical protein